jgi:hypothetical protein
MTTFDAAAYAWHQRRRRKLRAAYAAEFAQPLADARQAIRTAEKDLDRAHKVLAATKKSRVTTEIDAETAKIRVQAAAYVLSVHQSALARLEARLDELLTALP